MEIAYSFSLCRQREILVLFLSLSLLQPFEVRAQPAVIERTMPLGVTLPGPSIDSQADAALGAYLFYNKALSKDGSIACSSCHLPDFGFSDDKPKSLGVGNYKTSRKALPLFNLYLFKYYTADGRAKSLPEQDRIPLESPEMQVDWDRVRTLLSKDPIATALSAEAGIRVFNPVAITQALASYVGELVSGGSRFDRYFYGGTDDALTEQERRGFRIFLRKGRCSTCHLVDGISAPFTDAGFHSIGISFSRGVYVDHGRMDVTHKSTDDGLFKTPSLRNVAQRRFYMHDGSIRSLIDVVRYYNQGGTKSAPNQDPRIQPLFLTASEMDDLTAFLGSLTAPIVRYEPIQTILDYQNK